MKRLIALMTIFLTACGPDPTSQAPAQVSAALTTLSAGALCGRYTSSTATVLTRQMIEAELALRNISQCGGLAIGRTTAAGLGQHLYDRDNSPGSVHTPPSGRGYDCGNFRSEAEAQRFFLASGGPTADPYNLDGDGDGLACEWGAAISRIAAWRAPVATAPTYSAPSYSPRCHVGPRGGTYTITSGGNRNYSGC